MKESKKVYKPITFYADQDFQQGLYKRFQKICGRKGVSGSEKIREMITGFVKVNGRGQITLEKTLDIKKELEKIGCVCGSRKVFAELIRFDERLKVCYDCFHKLKHKYPSYKVLD